MRTGWTTQILDLVSWHDLQSGILSFGAHQQVTITKHTNGLLPLGCRILQTGMTRSQICPRCLGCIETDAHFVHCALASDDAASIANRSFKEKLEGHHIDASIIQILVRALFCTETDFARLTTDLPPSKAVDDCDIITQMELWRGKIPVSLLKPFLKNRCAKGWGRHIVTAIFDAFLALWRRRNDILHGRTDAPKQHEADVRERLSTLLSDFRSLPPDLQVLKNAPTSDSTIRVIECFLSWAELLLKKCKVRKRDQRKRPFTDYRHVGW